MSKPEEKLWQPQEHSAWMWTPLRMVAGSRVCWKGVLLAVSPSRLAPKFTPLDQGCVTLTPGASRHCVPSLLQTGMWTSQTKSGTHLYLSSHQGVQQTLPRPTFLSSDLWPWLWIHFLDVFSDEHPVTFRWGLKKKHFPMHFSISPHSAPEMSLRNIYGEVTHS